MRVTRKTRLQIRIENTLFVVLFLAFVGLLAWLSTRYEWQADWTANARHTLSEASMRLLERLEGPITITAYAREDEVLRGRIRDLADRYRRVKSDVSLSFVNPDLVPDQVRQLGVTVDGELLVSYQGRTEHVQSHSEQTLTSALQRVARAGERWLVFLGGHGERDPFGEANHDYGEWGRQLENRGFLVRNVNLAESGAVPDNTSVLVIAEPRVQLLAGEVALIQEYVASGGNLLWLAEGGDWGGLDALAASLGLEAVPGVVVDPTSRLFGLDHPALILVTAYPFHPALQDFNLLTLFPGVFGLATNPPPPWFARALLSTGARAWAETGELQGEVLFDEVTDTPGPLDIGFAFTRPRPAETESEATEESSDPEQRIVVVGDADFLSNSYLGNGGNLDLGLTLASWLASDEVLVAIPAKTAPDLSLNLSPTAEILISAGFLLLLPLLLLGTGITVWYQRRRR